MIDAQPPFTVVWEEGGFTEGDLVRVQPHMDTIFGLAIDGIHDLGLELTDTKNVNLKKIPSYCTEQYGQGECLDRDNIAVYLDTPAIMSMGLSSQIGRVTTTVVHELLHCLREGYVQTLNFPELTVTEGIAYYGHVNFMKALTPWERYKTGVNIDDLIASLSTGQVNEIVDDFFSTVSNVVEIEDTPEGAEELNAVCDNWFVKTVEGPLVGYIAVATLVEADHTPLADVIQMDSLDILSRLRTTAHETAA